MNELKQQTKGSFLSFKKTFVGKEMRPPFRSVLTEPNVLSLTALIENVRQAKIGVIFEADLFYLLFDYLITIYHLGSMNSSWS